MAADVAAAVTGGAAAGAASGTGVAIGAASAIGVATGAASAIGAATGSASAIGVATPASPWAEAIGQHALAAFFLTLPVWWLLAATAWWALDRQFRVDPAAGTPPAPRLAARLGLGFAVIVAAAWAFGEIAEAVGANAALGRFDTALASAFGRHTTPAVLRAFATVTHLGDTRTLTLLWAAVAVGLLCRRRPGLALAWSLAVGGNAVLNPALKGLFQRVRPSHDASIAAAFGWSFPSGHTSGATVAYGMLAYVLMGAVPRRWRLALVLSAATLIFATGWSRMVLQVHYASDVAGGLASGFAWLTVCVLGCEWTRHHRRGQRAAATVA